jgi:ABC-2 type transport system permease protein
MEKNFVGLAFGVIIYLFIFLYGVQVMRGVIEEKTSRIVEVIVCSVKPFQLMMGKIIGIALVGLTQFLIWVLLTGTLVVVFQYVFFSEFLDPGMVSDQIQAAQTMNQPDQVQQGLSLTDSVIHRINWPLMIGLFLFYFLGGYLLYAALFAAVGAAVDSETETQQFMIPVTIPLTIAYVFATTIAMNPESPMAYWMSIIPLFSPVVMLVRVAVGVGDGGIEYTDVLLSAVLLIAGFIGTTWVAARIYRVGILMYGKRTNYRELFKWLLRG